MLNIKTVIISGVIIFFSFFILIPFGYAHVNEKSKALSKLDSMPPEQKESMIKLLISSLPEEKKNQLQEAFNSIASKSPEVIMTFANADFFIGSSIGGIEPSLLTQALRSKNLITKLKYQFSA